jgi:hypothetical protein
MTPKGIEPATFRLLAQCLNQLRQRVRPDILRWLVKFTKWPLYNQVYKPPVPVHYSVGWAPEAVWTFRETKILLPITGR